MKEGEMDGIEMERVDQRTGNDSTSDETQMTGGKGGRGTGVRGQHGGVVKKHAGSRGMGEGYSIT